jgi:uncharacterized protein (DUF697 family)
MQIKSDRGRDDHSPPAGNQPMPNQSTAITTVERKAEELVKWITDKAISGVPPLLSAEELAEQYIARDTYGGAEERVDSLIKWESSKNFAAGFLTGLGGLAMMPVAIPAALGASWVLQARMAAAIARIYGHSLDEENVRTFVLLTLLGGEAVEILREVGVKLSNKLTLQLIKRIPGKMLTAINQKVGFRLLTKAGQTGVINLIKFVPIAGGVVGGTVDLLACHTVGKLAKKVFRPPGGKRQHYRVFYCFYGPDINLSAANAARMDITDICAELMPQLTSDGDFLGLIDDDGRTLQMMFQADDVCYRVEMPCPEKRGSYGCNMDLAQLAALMNALPSKFFAEAIPGLVFEAW